MSISSDEMSIDDGSISTRAYPSLRKYCVIYSYQFIRVMPPGSFEAGASTDQVDSRVRYYQLLLSCSSMTGLTICVVSPRS